ncbi:hypothetical protein GF324_00440 [bacterium]|nr:hypothetical protein [bacterium]
MPNPLNDIIHPSALQFNWVTHEEDASIGPFRFPAEVPIPVGAGENSFVQQPWLDVPYPGRGALPTGHDEAVEEINAEELVHAVLEGHLPAGADDYNAVTDHIGRCLLAISYFVDNEEQTRPLESIFTQAEPAATFFEAMLRAGKEQVHNAIHMAEQQKVGESMMMFVISRLQMHGAWLLSPTTPGLLYDIGVLHFDMGNMFRMTENEEEARRWVEGHVQEARYYLENCLADEAMRNETPAFYLLGASRELLGDDEGARSAYEKFLSSPAAEQFGDVRKAVEDKLKKE